MRKHNTYKTQVHVYTIKKEDNTKNLCDVVPGCDLGFWIFRWDVGKRIYKKDGVYQIESQEQLERRLGQ